MARRSGPFVPCTSFAPWTQSAKWTHERAYDHSLAHTGMKDGTCGLSPTSAKEETDCGSEEGTCNCLLASAVEKAASGSEHGTCDYLFASADEMTANDSKDGTCDSLLASTDAKTASNSEDWNFDGSNSRSLDSTDGDPTSTPKEFVGTTGSPSFSLYSGTRGLHYAVRRELKWWLEDESSDRHSGLDEVHPTNYGSPDCWMAIDIEVSPDIVVRIVSQLGEDAMNKHACLSSAKQAGILNCQKRKYRILCSL